MMIKYVGFHQKDKCLRLNPFSRSSSLQLALHFLKSMFGWIRKDINNLRKWHIVIMDGCFM